MPTTLDRTSTGDVKNISVILPNDPYRYLKGAAEQVAAWNTVAQSAGEAMGQIIPLHFPSFVLVEWQRGGGVGEQEWDANSAWSILGYFPDRSSAGIHAGARRAVARQKGRPPYLAVWLLHSSHHSHLNNSWGGQLMDVWPDRLVEFGPDGKAIDPKHFYTLQPIENRRPMMAEEFVPAEWAAKWLPDALLPENWEDHLRRWHDGAAPSDKEIERALITTTSALFSAANVVAMDLSLNHPSIAEAREEQIASYVKTIDEARTVCNRLSPVAPLGMADGVPAVIARKVAERRKQGGDS